MTLTSVQKTISYVFIFLLLILGFSRPVFAQSENQKQGKETTFQVSFVPGLSTSDSYSTSQISFNIIGGYNGAFHGFELGSVFNGNRYDVSGLQLSGAVNYNLQQAKGLLLSGALNITRTFAGGLSHAGAANITKNHSKGLMLAGGINITQITHGVTFAPMNITQNQMGTQLGTFNISKKLQGTQIGIINIVNENDGGTPIGLLSFVKNGRHNIDIWGSETGFINGGLRLGTESIYNILSIGYNPFYGDDMWQVGIGIGYHYTFDESSDGIETDLINYHVNYDGEWTTESSSHIQWRVHYTHALTEGTSIFSGPSINLMVSDEDQSTPQVPYTIYDYSSGGNQLRLWLGWTLGIELF